MKTIKFSSVFLSVLLLIGVARADKPKNRSLLTMKFSINAFIDADTRGICDGLADIIDDYAKFNMIRSGQTWSFDKKQIVNQMLHLRGVKQNCTTTFNIMETYGNYALYKVEMRYPKFSRINYITMNECSEGWKITNVTSVFTE
jgi:hypothetical protein